VPVLCHYIIESQGITISTDKGNYPFREAVLSDYKGDLSKTWWVDYYVRSELKGALVLKRSRFSQPTEKERYEQA